MGAGRLRPEADEAGGYAPLAEINVTPLVDVMLVLLIIFMVTAPLLTAGVPVRLPKTQAARVSQPKTPVVVSIDRDGRVYLRNEELAPEEIVPRLRALAAQDPEQVVLVRGDRSLDYGRVMELMGRVSAAGFAKVSLIAEMPGTPAAPAANAPAAPGVPAAPAVPAAP